MKLYSSPYSEFQFESARRMLTMIWSKESQDLQEEAVKAEMNRILSFIEQYQPRNIIVDARNYVFTNNLNIQNWITRTYMPVIAESKVQKYAIVVNSMVKQPDDSADQEKSIPEVEYFTDLEAASKWI